MTISKDEALALQGRINVKLERFSTSFRLTVHFMEDRLNDVRNQPPITVEELDSIFDRLLVNDNIAAIVALNHRDEFNIRCLESDINMPCAVEKTTAANNTVTHKSIVITIMRKKTFKAKDSQVEFAV
jgi:hypothetical protein